MEAITNHYNLPGAQAEQQAPLEPKYGLGYSTPGASASTPTYEMDFEPDADM